MFSFMRRRFTLFFPAAQRCPPSDDEPKLESRQEGGVHETWTILEVNNSDLHDAVPSDGTESGDKASPSVKNSRSIFSTLPPAKKQKRYSRPALVGGATLSPVSAGKTSSDNFYTTNSALAARDGNHALLPSPLLRPNRKSSSSRNRNYFPVSALNNHGRIGVYSPQERKVRLDQFRNKRKLRNFRKRYLHPSRQRIAQARPRGTGGKFCSKQQK